MNRLRSGLVCDQRRPIQRVFWHVPWSPVDGIVRNRGAESSCRRFCSRKLRGSQTR
jgi:hypothetical protein